MTLLTVLRARLGARTKPTCVIKLGGTALVSRSQTAFFRFYLWWRKKGLVWFTVGTRLDTFEVSIEHVIIALGL